MKLLMAVISVLGLVLCSAHDLSAKSAVLLVDSESLTARESERGTSYVVDFAVPEEVAGKRLDTVLLEFYVDIEADDAIETDYFPSIEVFPLSATPQLGREITFSRAFPTSRPVALGEGQLVSVDITDIVKGWIASPSTNHGVVIGSFSGPSVDGLDVRNNLIGEGKALRITYFYQNRFGDRISQRQ